MFKIVWYEVLDLLETTIIAIPIITNNEKTM